MLLLTISLFLHYDLISCLHYGKRNFNEDSLMKRHHQNFLQINDFIKEAQHRFHEETSVLGILNDKDKTTRDDKSLYYRNTTWWWDNSSFVDQLSLNTPRTFLLPVIRSRPSFPYSITPYTTELNERHLKWDEIFPDQNARLRSGPQVSSTLLNRSLPQTSSILSLKDQTSSGSTFQPPLLREGPRLLQFNTTFSHNSSFKDLSDLDFGLTTTSIPPNEDYMMWLREITMYTPVERWLQTLVNKVGMTPSYGFTTNHTTQVSVPSKPQTSVQNSQLKNDSKDQPHHMLRQGLPLADDEDYRISTATTKAQFFIVNVEGILHLRTVTEKVENTTKIISGRPATVLDDVTSKVTPTSARHVLHRERDPETQRPSYRKSRRFRSKARKRKRYHHPHKRKRTRLSQKHSYRHPRFSKDDKIQKQEEYPMLRRMRFKTTEGSRKFSLNAQSLKGKIKQKSRALFSNAVTRPTKTANLKEPTYLPTPNSEFISKRAYPEDGELLNLIEAQDELRIKETAQEDKISVQLQVTDSLKAAEKMDKDNKKRKKVKEELIRKIVAGSSYSYSDEEAMLRKNLVRALRYRKRT